MVTQWRACFPYENIGPVGPVVNIQERRGFYVRISQYAITPSPLSAAANRAAVRDRAVLTGREVTFGADSVIVSKTDTKGLITYANKTFLEVSGFSDAELLGAPHSILRHPHMPRCVFKFLWDNIVAKQEVFAYVLNRARNGDHYWVFAHVTPSVNRNGDIISYHSNRRCPSRAAIDKIAPIYRNLLDVEARAGSPGEAVSKGMEALLAFVNGTGLSYGELVFTL